MPQDTLNSDIAKLVPQLKILRTEEIKTLIVSRFVKYIHRAKILISDKIISQYDRTKDIRLLIDELNQNIEKLKNDIMKDSLYSDHEIALLALPAELKGFNLPDNIKKLFIETILKRFYQNNYSLLLFLRLKNITDSDNTQKVEEQLEKLRKLSLPTEAKEIIFKEYIDNTTKAFHRTPIKYSLQQQESYTNLSVWLQEFIDILGITINLNAQPSSNVKISEAGLEAESLDIIPKISVNGRPFTKEFLAELGGNYLNKWGTLPKEDYAKFLYNFLIYTIWAKITPLSISIKHNVEAILKEVGSLSKRDATKFLSPMRIDRVLPREKIRTLFIHLKYTGYANPNSIFTHPLHKTPIELPSITSVTSEYIKTLTNKIKEYEPLSSKQIICRDLDQSAHATDKKGLLNMYRSYDSTKQSTTSSNIAVKIESQGEKGEIRYYALITILRMLKNNKLVQDYLEGLPCMADLKGANLDTKDYIELNFTLIWNALSQPALSKTAQLNLYDPLTHEKITWTDIEPVTPRQPQPNIIPDHQIKDPMKPLNAQFFSLNLESGKPSESTSRPSTP